MATVFKPFANESTVISIGRLELENRADRVTIHGDLDLTRDKAGLKRALELKTRIDQIVTALQGERLPDQVCVEPTRMTKNPFRP